MGEQLPSRVPHTSRSFAMCAANQTFSNVRVALNETRDRLTRDGDYPTSSSSGEGIYNFGGEKATLNYEW